MYPCIRVSWNTYKHIWSRIEPVSLYPYHETYTNTEGAGYKMMRYIQVSWNKYKHRCSRIEHVSLHSRIMENYLQGWST